MSQDAPLVGVLALQGAVAEHVAALTASGARTRTVRRPAELDGLDGLVLPGGESTAMDLLLRRVGLDEPLRAAIAGGLPVYGSCAGMILLSDRLVDGAPGQRTLGGLDVTCRRNAFGRQVDSFETDLDVVGLAEPVHAVFIRAPWVEKAGGDVDVLAAVEVDGEQRPVLVRQGRLMASAFHPELTGDHRLHGLFLDVVAGADSRHGVRRSAG
ncbi:pyridoxal 5'-phosphate synthase glutaminase subunit PdxT [Nocardioides sp. CFH 31398]|uniref:pyridoxal 5'-phosphate synthase glutaminase subunit PdxT n=1 Tax=Nocardioides sp. CFH 31398 TaxID=2919579 RepID=UPI001F06C3A9|nr:pyridoxal 5'-phosphate synthase glutaminase subunit PdxT [Nocardioides sp. CFH 31398]MCH1867805.1 pyridoxal 5'-phosphate synthase glutaminase subunit PdxT [Nocardioides sp. CFH 31398]